MPAILSCYKCGQPGHISRFCPLSDRRLNGSQLSNAIVPAQPSLTARVVTNVGTVVPYFSGQYNGGGGGNGLVRRVSTLEEIVGKINSKHEADEAREQREREQDERRKREKDDEERRSTVVIEIDQVARLRAQVEQLKRGNDGASTSATGGRVAKESKEVARLRSEHAEDRAARGKRWATLEEVICALQKQCEAPEANVEVWRNEALRPGNKRGSIAIRQTPGSAARVRPRVTPGASPCPVGRVDQQVKAMVERHQREVDLLNEMGLREVNARKESEDEIERLKEAMAKLETSGRARGTNLRNKLDDAAGPSACKDTGETVLAGLVNRREIFVREERKQLRNLRKEEVISICKKEGIECTKLDPTKEAIIQGRADRAFESKNGTDVGKGIGKVDYVVDIPDDGEDNLHKGDGHDSATS
ncbi:hypothetical protein CBR_g68774 [Chara braunii]|uniref:CCHC-type domain-containing protein n=1 Tax=Chara braunii TaxID=69332 RepID=A0A388K9Q5_CHABU|nr:hypothetical protein CBR_g68774 [Chara braunii]|eukprot:GBG66788.1 hypothetical protein CBR_g68774 [Chara braunii]